MQTLDELETCINKSTLSPENKQRLLRLCATLKAWIIRLKKLLDSIVTLLRRHSDFFEAMGIAILLAMILSLVPWIGQLLAGLALLAGLLLALLRDMRQNLESILSLVDLEKENIKI